MPIGVVLQFLQILLHNIMSEQSSLYSYIVNVDKKDIGLLNPTKGLERMWVNGRGMGNFESLFPTV